MRLLCIISILFCIATPSAAQELIKLTNGCVYSGDEIKKEVYSFESDNEANNALTKLMRHTGLPANFIIKAADVPNAQASVIGATRYIFYSQLFMARVKNQTQNDWSAISILAHEIGHHLSGHTLDGLGSRPNKELEADRFSGFILSKMGASLNESLLAMNTIASDQGSYTHPPKSARIAAITNGWTAAKDIDKTPEIPKRNTEPPVIVKTNTAIAGRFNQTWVEHNIFNSGRKGMNIHIDYSTDNMKDKKGVVGVFFYYSNGNALKDFNGLYNSANGNIAAYYYFTPIYENAKFTDLIIFMPYDELHMGKGNFDLKFTSSLFYENPSGGYTEIIKSQDTFFTYSSN